MLGFRSYVHVKTQICTEVKICALFEGVVSPNPQIKYHNHISHSLMRMQ